MDDNTCIHHKSPTRNKETFNWRHQTGSKMIQSLEEFSHRTGTQKDVTLKSPHQPHKQSIELLDTSYYH